MTTDEIITHIEHLEDRIHVAYANMKSCRDDDHLEGEDMWYSIALDREEDLKTYVQQVRNHIETALESFE